MKANSIVVGNHVDSSSNRRYLKSIQEPSSPISAAAISSSSSPMSTSSSHKQYYEFQHHHIDYLDYNGNSMNSKRKYKTVDVLSIGTKTDKLAKSLAQNVTWGAHHSIRNFWISDESDDENYEQCLRSNEDYGSHTSHCQKMGRDHKKSTFQRWLRKGYATERWLTEKKKNPTGWLCAQKRPLLALAKVARTYQRQFEKLEDDEDPDSILPDYLILADDDTFVNIDLIQDSIWQKEVENKEPSQEPVIQAGCLISDIQNHFWSFEYGGFGTFFNRAAIQRMLIQPIHCENNERKGKEKYNKNSDVHFVNNVCNISLKQNLLNEQKYFEEGSTVMEIFEKFVIAESYGINAIDGSSSSSGSGSDDDVSSSLRQQKQQQQRSLFHQDSYCLHSDWTIGYMTNFYFLSKVYDIHDGDSYYNPEEILRHRMHTISSDNSDIWYLNYKTWQISQNCNNNSYEDCLKNLSDGHTNHVCHYINEKQMVSIWERIEEFNSNSR